MLETFKATARKLPNGLAVETKARGFKIIFDEPPALGGEDQGMNPVEGLLCTLGACEAIVAAAFAKYKGFHYEDFYVELEGDLDLDGFKGVPGVPKGYQEVRFKMHFKTEESQARCEEFAQFIESTCPIFSTLKEGTKLVCTGVERHA